MGVNTNTVLRAMRILRDEGLLEFRRGHGIHVTGAPAARRTRRKSDRPVRFAASAATTAPNSSTS